MIFLLSKEFEFYNHILKPHPSNLFYLYNLQTIMNFFGWIMSVGNINFIYMCVYISLLHV